MAGEEEYSRVGPPTQADSLPLLRGNYWDLSCTLSSGERGPTAAPKEREPHVSASASLGECGGEGSSATPSEGQDQGVDHRVNPVSWRA